MQEPREAKFYGPTEEMPFVSEDGSTVLIVYGTEQDKRSFLVIRDVDDPTKELFLRMDERDLCERVTGKTCEAHLRKHEKPIRQAFSKHRWREFQDYWPTSGTCEMRRYVEFSIPPYRFTFDTPNLNIDCPGCRMGTIVVPLRWDGCEESNQPYISWIGIAKEQRVMVIVLDVCVKGGCRSDPYYKFLRLPK